MPADIFLKIDGVEGESKDSKHSGEIELQSYNLGATQPGSANVNGGLGSGKVHMHDVLCVASASKASPSLLHACANGDHFGKATITARKAGKGQQEYVTITMSHVLISNYQHGGSAQGADIPTDQFALNFAKIDFEYKEQKEEVSLGGKVKKGGDVKANKPT